MCERGLEQVRHARERTELHGRFAQKEREGGEAKIARAHWFLLWWCARVVCVHLQQTQLNVVTRAGRGGARGKSCGARLVQDSGEHDGGPDCGNLSAPKKKDPCRYRLASR